MTFLISFHSTSLKILPLIIIIEYLVQEAADFRSRYQGPSNYRAIRATFNNTPVEMLNPTILRAGLW